MTKARELADVIGTQSTTENVLQGRRNLIINGAMQVAQRGTSFSGVNSNNVYTLDRFAYQAGGGAAPVFTITQQADAPSGFANCYKIETTTADSDMSTANYVQISYPFEGQDLQQLNKGTSDAKEFTLSFWVKSNVTGTYAVLLWDSPNSRQNTASYTVNASGVWEYKTITFAGDTTGTIDNDSTVGLEIKFVLGVGTDYTGGSEGPSAHSGNTQSYAANHAVNVAGIVGNTWQITGVQLEVGTVATPFEHRSYGEELALCQRYYEKRVVRAASSSWGLGSSETLNRTFNVTKRAAPTISYTGSWGGTTPGANGGNTDSMYWQTTSSFYSDNTATEIFDAEL